MVFNLIDILPALPELLLAALALVLVLVAAFGGEGQKYSARHSHLALRYFAGISADLVWHGE